MVSPKFHTSDTRSSVVHGSEKVFSRRTSNILKFQQRQNSISSEIKEASSTSKRTVRSPKQFSTPKSPKPCKTTNKCLKSKHARRKNKNHTITNQKSQNRTFYQESSTKLKLIIVISTISIITLGLMSVKLINFLNPEKNSALEKKLLLQKSRNPQKSRPATIEPGFLEILIKNSKTLVECTANFNYVCEYGQKATRSDDCLTHVVQNCTNCYKGYHMVGLICYKDGHDENEHKGVVEDFEGAYDIARWQILSLCRA